MKSVIIFSILFSLAQAARLLSAAGKTIPGSYIVVLKNGNTADSFMTEFKSIPRKNDYQPTNVHKFDIIPGFSATLDDATREELLNADKVDYIEPDAVVTIQAVQANAPWGLARISQNGRFDPWRNRTYFYNDAAGSGVIVYVIDTGINTGHRDLQGRIIAGKSFVPAEPDVCDHNGHGTHVAGIVAGTTYGAAKKVSIVGVKVLGAAGNGSTSNMIQGVEWAVQHAQGRKAVVNMSIGAGYSQAMNDAVNNAAAQGVP
ncbi:Subtilisin-like protease 3, partial [Mortierella alpina]